MKPLPLITLSSMVVLAACSGQSDRPLAATAQAGTPPRAANAQLAQAPAPGGHEMNMPTTKGSLKVVSPRDGEKIASTDIPIRIAVSNFRLSGQDAGRPDVDSVGHVHVMLDGENMGVLFNFYGSNRFTLPGEAITPGHHTLIFDLASNTHMDFANTVQKVDIDYRPAKPKLAPKARAQGGPPEVTIASPANGATVGPKFTVRVQPANFTPSLGLEGKPNQSGYGHYHVMVDLKMAPMMPMAGGEKHEGGQMGEDMGGMMSMAGMVAMPGSNAFPVDLSAWGNGRHTITVMPVQNDHTPIAGAKSATVTVNVTGTEASLTQQPSGQR